MKSSITKFLVVSALVLGFLSVNIYLTDVSDQLSSAGIGSSYKTACDLEVQRSF